MGGVNPFPKPKVSGGHTVLDEGSELPSQPNLDFQGAGVEARDEVGKTVVDIPGIGGSINPLLVDGVSVPFTGTFQWDGDQVTGLPGGHGIEIGDIISFNVVFPDEVWVAADGYHLFQFDAGGGFWVDAIVVPLTEDLSEFYLGNELDIVGGIWDGETITIGGGPVSIVDKAGVYVSGYAIADVGVTGSPPALPVGNIDPSFSPPYYQPTSINFNPLLGSVSSDLIVTAIDTNSVTVNKTRDSALDITSFDRIRKHYIKTGALGIGTDSPLVNGIDLRAKIKPEELIIDDKYTESFPNAVVLKIPSTNVDSIGAMTEGDLAFLGVDVNDNIIASDRRFQKKNNSNNDMGWGIFTPSTMTYDLTESNEAIGHMKNKIMNDGETSVGCFYDAGVLKIVAFDLDIDSASGINFYTPITVESSGASGGLVDRLSDAYVDLLPSDARNMYGVVGYNVSGSTELRFKAFEVDKDTKAITILPNTATISYTTSGYLNEIIGLKGYNDVSTSRTYFYFLAKYEDNGEWKLKLFYYDFDSGVQNFTTFANEINLSTGSGGFDVTINRQLQVWLKGDDDQLHIFTNDNDNYVRHRTYNTTISGTPTLTTDPTEDYIIFRLANNQRLGFLYVYMSPATRIQRFHFIIMGDRRLTIHERILKGSGSDLWSKKRAYGMNTPDIFDMEYNYHQTFLMNEIGNIYCGHSAVGLHMMFNIFTKQFAYCEFIGNIIWPDSINVILTNSNQMINMKNADSWSIGRLLPNEGIFSKYDEEGNAIVYLQGLMKVTSRTLTPGRRYGIGFKVDFIFPHTQMSQEGMHPESKRTMGSALNSDTLLLTLSNDETILPIEEKVIPVKFNINGGFAIATDASNWTIYYTGISSGFLRYSGSVTDGTIFIIDEDAVYSITALVELTAGGEIAISKNKSITSHTTKLATITGIIGTNTIHTTVALNRGAWIRILTNGTLGTTSDLNKAIIHKISGDTAEY